MKTKYYWKVVCKSPYGGLTSACHRFNTFHLNYEIGKETVPLIGKIFIFSRREDARRFKNRQSTPHLLKILKVKANNPFRFYLRADPDTANISWFWKLMDQNILPYSRDGHYVDNTPEGTFVADSITPVEFSR